MSTADQARMGFMEHLRELRGRLRNVVIAYLVAVAVTYLFAESLFLWLAQPLLEVWPTSTHGAPVLHFKNPVEPLFVYVKIALLGGLFLASPAIFWQLWKFVAPGLHVQERRAIIPFVGASVLCFAGGAAFGYTVIFPFLFRFLLGFASSSLSSIERLLGGTALFAVPPLRLQPTLMMEEYLGLVSKTLLVFGLCFELPVFLLSLGLVGIVDHRSLLRFSRYAVIVIFILAAIVTPDPTATTQVLLALPLIALYYLGVLLVYLFGRKRLPQS